MPLCASGRHFYSNDEYASACCNFRLQDGGDLAKSRQEIAAKLSEIIKEISQAEVSVTALRVTRDGMQKRLDDFQKSRVEKIISGEQPITEPEHAFLRSDIEGLDAVIGKRANHLEALNQGKAVLESSLANADMQLARITRHKALAKLHAKMLGAVQTWNQCAKSIGQLRLEANDMDSGLNNGEYPLLPPGICIDNKVANQFEMTLTIFGLIPRQNFLEENLRAS